MTKEFAVRKEGKGKGGRASTSPLSKSRESRVTMESGDSLLF